MALNVASLVEPIAGDAPTGLDPAIHDGVYQALQQAIKGRVEYKVDGKDEVRVFHPPDWRAVYDQALDCASRTRDLRVCIMLTRAAASSDGPAGLTAGLELLRETCARFWDELHPALDSDASDPSEQAFRRVTALNELADRSGLLRDLRDMPILEARGIGRYGLRAIHLAQGKEAPAPGEEAPESGLIQGALDNDPGIADTRAAIAACPAGARQPGTGAARPPWDGSARSHAPRQDPWRKWRWRSGRVLKRGVPSTVAAPTPAAAGGWHGAARGACRRQTG